MGRSLMERQFLNKTVSSEGKEPSIATIPANSSAFRKPIWRAIVAPAPLPSKKIRLGLILNLRVASSID